MTLCDSADEFASAKLPFFLLYCLKCPGTSAVGSIHALYVALRVLINHLLFERLSVSLQFGIILIIIAETVAYQV